VTLRASFFGPGESGLACFEPGEAVTYAVTSAAGFFCGEVTLECSSDTKDWKAIRAAVWQPMTGVLRNDTKEPCFLRFRVAAPFSGLVECEIADGAEDQRGRPTPEWGAVAVAEPPLKRRATCQNLSAKRSQRHV